MDSVTEREKMIEKYLEEGNQEAAVKELFDLIVECAKKKDFSRAEKLRERLLEAAPLALNEITRSADIIDEEKSGAIDDDHRKTWAELYNALTAEEGNELYFAMEEKEYEEGEIIFSVGDTDKNLYFLDSGEARMFFRDKDEEMLKVLEPGSIAGEDTFFYATALRTVSLIAGSRVKIRSLKQENLKKWKERFPALEEKLLEYCSKSGPVYELLKKNGLSRRQNKRKKLKGKVAVELLTSSGAPTGKKFIGSLSDISMSGLSFTFKLSNNEVAQKLLGAGIKTQLLVPEGGSSKKIEQTGKIVGIGYNVLADHSIHVRFNEIDETIKKLIGL